MKEPTKSKLVISQASSCRTARSLRDAGQWSRKGYRKVPEPSSQWEAFSSGWQVIHVLCDLGRPLTALSLSLLI